MLGGGAVWPPREQRPYVRELIECDRELLAADVGPRAARAGNWGPRRLTAPAGQRTRQGVVVAPGSRCRACRAAT
jgi:hypothetical protein